MTNITPLDFDPNRRDRESRLRSHDPAMDGVEEYEGVGADFAAARREAGLDVSHVVATLRIRQQHLTAIEEGRFADLPAPGYAVGFVRSYAEFLGLDAGAAIQAFKEETQNSRERVSLIFPSADAEDRVPRGWLLGMSGILALVVFGAWFYSENSNLIRPERVPEPPTRVVDRAAPAGGAEDFAIAAPIALPAPAPVDSPAGGEAAPGIALAPIEVPDIADVPDVPFVAEIEAALAERPEGAAGIADQPIDPMVGRVLGVIPVAADEEGALAAGDVAIGDAMPEPAEAAADPAAAPGAIAIADAVADADSPIPAPGPVAAPAPALDEPVAEPQAQAIPAPAPLEAEPDPVPLAAPEPVAPEPEVIAAAPEVEVAALPPPAAEPAVVPAAPAPAPAVPPAAPAEVAGLPGGDPQVFGENQDTRVVILARQDSWVQITGTAGELLLTRILRAGDRYLAPDREDLILMTGNAGALEITVDGVQIAPLGPVGTVRRNVSLAPERLLAGGR